MNCPVCGKDARTHIYHCAACAAYVHEKCWPKHEAEAHQETD
ncbi:MAG: hypothetical protein V3R96_02775 [Dehalococcoidales bacterium]